MLVCDWLCLLSVILLRAQLWRRGAGYYLTVESTQVILHTAPLSGVNYPFDLLMLYVSSYILSIGQLHVGQTVSKGKSTRKIYMYFIFDHSCDWLDTTGRR